MKSTSILTVGLLVALFHVLSTANTANILSLVELLPPDQQIWHDAIYKGLTDRGHKLTVVSGDRMARKSKDIAQIHLEQVRGALGTKNPPSFFANKWLSPFERTFRWYDRQMKICNGVLSSSGLNELIELARGAGAVETFDLIMYDATYGPSCLLALAQLFEDVPIVAVSASHITTDLLKIARGTQIQSATVPHFTTVHDEHMNFFERLHNTIVYAISNFFRHFTVATVQEAMLAKSALLQEAHTASTYEQTIDRIKVVLVNSHPAIDYVYTLPPNVIEVGGLHFDNINRPLSVDMQTFVDNSKEGVFIVTLGSLGNFEELAPELIEAVLATIDNFPEYGFVWGIDRSALPSGSRKNLFVGKWLKKCNILAARKVKGLITGGNHMEVQAAAYHGVPIIGIADGLNQPNIARRVQALGFGLSVDLLSSGSETLQNALNAIILEQRFAANAKSRQLAFRSRPQNPLDVALWWIEHVLAHPTESGFLYPQAAAETSFIAMHYLDVGFILVLILTVFLINCIIVLRQLKESCSTQTRHENKGTDFKRKIKKTNGNKKKTQ